MADKSNDPSAVEASQVNAATALLLEREERRKRRAKKRAKRRSREQFQEDRESVQRMHRSIEVIKWSIVAICTVWVISFIISLVVLVKVNSKIAQIETKVKRIQHVMENPFASAGARFGAEVDERIRQVLAMPEPDEDAE